MADQIPVRARLSGADVIALQEFEPTDTIPLSLISGFAAGVTTELGNNDISALQNVNVPTPANGEVLTFNNVSGNWEATTPALGITDHTLLSNIGTNTHAQIDTHIADSTVHFTQAAISITESQVSNLQPYLLDITNEPIGDLIDVNVVGVVGGQVLTYNNGTGNWEATTPAPGVTDHTLLTNIGTNTHAQIDTHIADGTIHYLDAPADAQDYVRNNNGWIVATQATFGEYQGTFDASVGTFPVTTNSGDWFNVDVAGTVDGQVFAIGDMLMALVPTPSTTIFAGNWTVIPNVSITDHTLLTNIGTNTHAQIDTHIADGTVHYTQGAISITESQISDLQNYALVGHTHTEADIIDLQAYLIDITGEPIKDLADVNVAGVTNGQVLTFNTVSGNWEAATPAPGVTDHTLLTNIGSNTHAQIDTHIADGTVHYTQASISITESQISDLQPYLLDITGESIDDLSDVNAPAPVNGQVLIFSGGAWVSSTLAPPIWGTITGTLSDQLDLQSALDTKVETASNIGTGDGVFAQKVAQDLEFKTLVAGENVQIASTATEVTISSRKDKFFAHNGPVTQTFGTTLINVLFPTVVRSDPSYTYSNGEVTINTAGWYFIEYQVSIGNTGNTRASSETGVTVNSLTVFEPGSLGYAYHRNASSGRATFSGRILVQLAVNDIIRIMTHKDGAGTTLETLADACRLTIITTGAP